MRAEEKGNQGYKMKLKILQKVFVSAIIGLYTSGILLMVHSDTIPIYDGNSKYSHKDYCKILEERLIRPLSKEPVGFYLVVPAFSAEKILILENDKGKNLLIYRKFKANLWYSLKHDSIPGVESKEIEINDENASRIGKFLKKSYILCMTNRKPSGLDGVSYYFAIPDSTNKILKRSEVWSPEKDSEYSKVINRAESIINCICDDKTVDKCISEELNGNKR